MPLSDWVPVLQELVWPAFIVFLAFYLKGPFTQFAIAVTERVRAGAELSIGRGGLTVGKLERLSEEQKVEIAESGNKTDEELARPLIAQAPPEAMGNAATKARPDLMASGLIDERVLYLVHTARRHARPPQGTQELWDVEVRVDADSPVILDQIEKVVYRLHPTFSPQDRTVGDRRTDFAMQLTVWGQFVIEADVYFRNRGQPLHLTRFLDF